MKTIKPLLVALLYFIASSTDVFAGNGDYDEKKPLIEDKNNFSEIKLDDNKKLDVFDCTYLKECLTEKITLNNVHKNVAEYTVYNAPEAYKNWQKTIKHYHSKNKIKEFEQAVTDGNLEAINSWIKENFDQEIMKNIVQAINQDTDAFGVDEKQAQTLADNIGKLNDKTIQTIAQKVAATILELKHYKGLISQRARKDLTLGSITRYCGQGTCLTGAFIIAMLWIATGGALTVLTCFTMNNQGGGDTYACVQAAPIIFIVAAMPWILIAIAIGVPIAAIWASLYACSYSCHNTLINRDRLKEPLENIVSNLDTKIKFLEPLKKEILNWLERQKENVLN